MTVSIPIAVPSGPQLEGRAPVVIIGPNGSGKTRFSTQLAAQNSAELVSALRNIQLQPELQGHSLVQARNQLQSLIENRRSNYWQLSNEIDWLFAKLLAEDATSAMRFRDASASDPSAKPEDTVLQRTRRLWSRVFPGRKISFDSYSPVVASEYSGAGSLYTADRMSDGERVALYLAARVLNARPGLIIVDEPELYFHSRLAIRFWDELEQERPDLRFVYITHDLPFALSRTAAQFILLQPAGGPQVLAIDEHLPEAVATAILGAASFSIYARRIVFCEGTEAQTSDFALYRAWFSERGTAVIPVGSCRDVIRCTETFGTSKLVTGVSSIGLIDRDYWPLPFLNAIGPNVQPLKVHELESLYVLRGIVTAVAKHLGATPEAANALYDSLLANIRSQLPDTLLTKQIAERCKTRLEPLVQAGIGALKGADTMAAFDVAAVAQLNPANWGVDVATVYAEEKGRVLSGVTGSEEELLAIVPGKPLLPLAAKAVGMTTSAYRELVETALMSTDQSLTDLRAGLEAALSGHLPPREYVEAPV